MDAQPAGCVRATRRRECSIEIRNQCAAGSAAHGRRHDLQSRRVRVDGVHHRIDRSHSGRTVGVKVDRGRDDPVRRVDDDTRSGIKEWVHHDLQLDAVGLRPLSTSLKADRA